MGWDINDKDNGYPLLILSVGGVSITCSGIVILMFIFNKSLRTFSTQMIVCICLSDILFTLGVICNSHFIDLTSRFICNLSAFLMVFGSLSSLSWGCIISYTVYLNTLHNGDKSIIDQSKKIVKTKSITFAYLIPFFLAVIPMFFEDYQVVGDICDITKNTYSGYVTSILVGLVPLLIEILIIFTFILKALKQQSIQHKYSSKLLLVYPMITLIGFGSFFIEHIYEIILHYDGKCNYDWHCISFVLCAIIGSLNAIFYGLNSSICLPISGLIRISSHTNSSSSSSSTLSDNMLFNKSLSNQSTNGFRESDKYICMTVTELQQQQQQSQVSK